MADPFMDKDNRDHWARAQAGSAREAGPKSPMLSLRYLEETRERVQVVEVIDPDGTVVGNLPVTEVVVRSLAADVATLTVTMLVAEAAVEAMHFRKRTPDA